MTHHAMDPYETTRPRPQQPKPTHHPQPCPCGCAPCEEPCCELECVDRPRFYCGQLLGDDDLTALVEWTRGRLRRARYRHGWGVVCGLNVRCDHETPTAVVLSPGYAVDCCGEDIVVCDEVRIDLADACGDETCLDPWRERAAEDSANQQEQLPDRCPDVREVLAGAAAIDLYLHYQEQHSHPEASLGSCGCGNGQSCEYSRTQEGYRWTWKAVSPEQAADPRTKEYDDWLNAYRRHLRRLSTFLDEVERAQQEALRQDYDDPDRPPSAASVRRKLQRWVRQHRPHQFCFVEPWISQWDDERLLDNDCLSRILFWLAMEYRLAWLRCDCPRCDPQMGVPLARVWLQIPDYRRQRDCRVLLVNAWPPYRRPIQPDECLPAARDCINVGQFLWQRQEEVAARYEASFQRMRIPQNLGQLREWVENEIEIDLCYRPSPQDPVALATVDFMNDRDLHVVGFSHFGTRND